MRNLPLLARFIAFASLPIAAPSEAAAQSLTPSLPQFHHTAWTVRDGAPSDAQALAQTSDGYLWVGTAAGLFRFDGTAFERFESRATPLRSADISSLSTGALGELWIGYRFGGASVLHEGRARTFTDADGMPSGTIFDFAFVGDTVWVAGSGGVGWFDGAKWHRVVRTDSVNPDFSTVVMVDRRKRVWFSSREGLYMRERRGKRFRLVGPSLGGSISGALREGSNGVIWASSSRTGLWRLTDSAGRIVATPARIGPASTGAILIDRHGALWVTTDDGIARYTSTTPPSPFEQVPPEDLRMGESQGISGDAAVSLLQDREGNVWAATAGGIDRFRSNRLNRIRLARRSYFPAVLPAEEGNVLIASATTPVVRVRDRVVEIPGAPSQVEAVSRDHEGNAWLAGSRSLWRGTGERFDPIALPPEIGANPIQAVARDRSGTLWISVVRSGVWRMRDSVWRRDGRVGPRDQAAMVIVPDRKRRTWFGFFDNRVVILEVKYRTLSTGEGLNIGAVLVIQPRGDRTWIGGERGVAVVRGDRVSMLRGWEQFAGTSGIIETASGDVWLNARMGVIKLAAADVQRALADSTFSAPYEVMDFRDGREGAAPQLRPIPSAVQGSDGRLWFTTGSQVAWIDTAAVERNPLPPPVFIRSMLAGDSTYEPRDSIHLDKDTRDVQLSYTALSLSIPERIRFRYRLEGADTLWHDAGDRRVAYFTNLGPGAYRFHVIASNNDGVWNDVGASQIFSIEPRFTETRSFYVLIGATGLAVILLLNALRHRQVARGLRARYDAKLEERTRIAQELHDTLLQGFTGITLQLEAVQRSLPARPDVAVETLSRVLGLADRTLRDARHMVWDMRAPELDTMDLATAVGAAARTMSDQGNIVLNYVVRGDRRRLPLARETAVLRIAREAVTNAVRHARAQLISVELTYEQREIRLQVSDNGRGLVQAEMLAASKEGHWGMEGMRGRAERLGGTLRIESVEGRGTDVTLTLPLTD